MPLPQKTLRVFPNPWALIHHELGPQGACVVDLSGRDGESAPLRWVGAKRVDVLVEKREDMKIGAMSAPDPRGNRAFARFIYPDLGADLVSGKPTEVPNTSYYLQKLTDGDLIPGDEKTSKLLGKRAAFASLQEAKAAGVAKFDANLGEGTWLEIEALLRESAPAAATTTSKKAPEGKNV